MVESYKMEVVIPQELCRAHKPPKGYVTASEMFLKFGVQFLLCQFFRNILHFYGLTVFPVTPNGWARMIGLYVLFMEQKMATLTPEEFSWFYTLKANKGNQGFIILPNGLLRESRPLPRLRKVLATRRTPSFSFPRLVFEVGASSKYP